MVHLVGYFGSAAIFLLMMVLMFHALIWPTLKHRKKPFLEWVVIAVFGFGMLRGMAVKPGDGDALQGPHRSPPQQTAEPTNSVEIATTTNTPPWETTLAFSHIETTPSNVQLTVAWPIGFYNYDPLFDLFIAYPSLTNDWHWITCQAASSSDTNSVFTVTPSLLDLDEMPPALFARVTERTETCETMDDSDGDGVPNPFEFYHGTNPYAPDANLIQTLDCAGTDFSTLKSVLVNSTEYSIINLPTGTIDATESIVMPPHPVLLTGPKNGYTVIKSTADLGAFMFKNGQDSHTLVRNVYLNLLKRDSFQVGFWCGGNLPWSGIGASPTFENVIVRTPRPETQYIAWLLYGDSGESLSLKNCLVNALGATNVRGVEASNGPSIDLINCSFLNFPSNGLSTLSRTFSLGNTGTTNTIIHQGAEATIFVDLAPSVDSDGDGIPNERECNELSTDPWLDDSDGDGVPDPDELIAGTDPLDVSSFLNGVIIEVTNTTTVAGSQVYISWERTGNSPDGGFITNSSARSFFTSFSIPHTNGDIRISSFRDLNNNTVFDPDFDIALSQTVSGHSEYTRLKFTFGDVDHDGISDLQERDDGTDPYSASSLRITRTVSLENDDPFPSVTNYVAQGLTRDWNAGEPFHRLSGTSETLTFSTNAINGAVYLKCYRDFNRNGAYDEGVEPLYVYQIQNSTPPSGDTIPFSIKDKDGDSIPDSIEWSEGTDINNRRSYCYNAALTVTGIFATTNQLYAQPFFGTNALAAAHLVCTNQEEYYFGHLSTTTSEHPIIKYWDDLNGNLALDDNEPFTSASVEPNGHETSLVYDLPYSKFDANNNRLPDWWEIATGLSRQPSHAPTDDNDHDGLINLHEFWSGTDPLQPDGSNTLFSIFSRSVDDRLIGMDPKNSMQIFVDYFQNGSRGLFISNTNCWIKDVDFSCAAAWHPGNEPGSMTATAITRRHVIMSAHWRQLNYTFLTPSGVTTNLTVVSRYQIPGSDLLLGRLAADLPDSVSIPYILPPNYTNFISNGKYLPTVCLNKEKHATILELDNLNTSVYCDRYKYSDYIEVSNTNVVTTQRAIFRSTTSDGNSSTPVFFILGNKLLLLFAKHCANTGNSETWWTAWGPSLTLRINQIQNQINIWEGIHNSEYQIKILDLSDYPELQRKK